ncbi:prion-inhibition and propagation-domain-containing protein [Lineolata rhizophorae]|uniref:Prion-inhibition and propagation-domain-containing protein n=1 Tax=Lineolata rhizophorae TaxID=578093 RepID=A0A6A6P2D8_9PEZI|nr:prion-inhibition and propagation-domain-containing protein [Lineolata rhizophorae]
MADAVSLSFQVFSICIKGYQLLSDAKDMPKEWHHLRIRLKTEQYRLIDWAHVAQLDEAGDKLLISNASKGLFLDVLDEQQKLLLGFGKYDERHKKFSRPMLVELAEEAGGAIPGPPPYNSDGYDGGDSGPCSPTIARAETGDIQKRFPQSEELLQKSLAFMDKTRLFPKRLRWALWDQSKVETLIAKLSCLNDFLKELLDRRQLATLAEHSMRTNYQIIQLHSKVDHLMELIAAQRLGTSLSAVAGNRQGASLSLGDNAGSPVRSYMRARGFEDEGSADEDADGDGVADGERRDRERRPGLADLAGFKALSSAINAEQVTDEFAGHLAPGLTRREIEDVELRRREIELIGEDGDCYGGNDDGGATDGCGADSWRAEAWFKPRAGQTRRVWIEWKRYDPVTFEGTPDPKTEARVRALATLLAKNNRADRLRDAFGAPHCLGYFRDVDDEDEETEGGVVVSPTKEPDQRCRFGLVFEKPGGVRPDTRPVSLLELLRDAGRDVPSLTDRIALARTVAECLERLHAVDWLHKGLRSDNIVFFPDEAGNVHLSRPFVSGFDYSRPAMNEDMTEKPPENPACDLYRHPKVHGGVRDLPPQTPPHASPHSHQSASSSSAFKKSYDIYSLGVILLEIARWQPLDKMLGIPDIDRAKPKQTRLVRNRLLREKEFLGFIRSYLGNTFEEVVRACLVGPKAFGIAEDADEKDGLVGEVLQRAFYANVVGKLVEMRV